jgi:hypothetical protein
MYCNENLNGKYWAVVAQNFPDHFGIRITEGQLHIHIAQSSMCQRKK